MPKETKSSAKSGTVSRKHIRPDEIEKLLKAAAGNRYPERDRLMILMAYRHGLRSCELIRLKWDDVDFAGKTLFLRRAKGSRSCAHPIERDELRALKKLYEARTDDFIFLTERGKPFTTSGVRKLLSRLGAAAGLDISNPHALRHACGYKLANDGTDLRLVQAWLGHSNIQNTVRYTELSAERFKTVKWS